ncbi:hypothetical protein PT274_01450 [Leuconostocaceae bacterium ESL0958]|nr:hypothetical protein [Leuconostocaceae bacterium ESL0958]
MGLDTVELAMRRAKSAAAMLYRDTATIYSLQNDGPSQGFSDSSKGMKIIAENVPVKVNKKQLSSLTGNGYAVDQYDAVILMDNSVKVPAGALFEVTDINGVKKTYRQSSQGYSSYATHQEIAVKYGEQR